MTEHQAKSRIRFKRFARIGPFALFVAACLVPSASAQETKQVSAVSSASPDAPAGKVEGAAGKGSPTIIVGFLGGYVSGKSPIRSEVKMAARLRADYPGSIRVETFANRDMSGAYDQILKFISANQQGKPTDEEKHRARIIVFGHSWGGTATVELARRLQKVGIPVLLTIQIDSVKHWYVDDSVIPANVEKAANFYQNNGMLRGRAKISAADPAHTNILGNYRFDYVKNPVACQGYPFWDRWFSKTHMEIECDPKVWKEVESLIRSELPPPAPAPEIH
jgi:pimeloyl-ACP methyl ester carboxylesterase